MKKVLYDVYDRDELVLSGVTGNEVKTFLGRVDFNISHYVSHGFIYMGRYTIVKCGTEVINFAVEWEKAVAPFRRIQWVKSGGRKLKIGGGE